MKELIRAKNNIDHLRYFIPEKYVGPAKVSMTDDGEVGARVCHQVGLDGMKVLREGRILFSFYPENSQ